jgi:putative transposase
MRVIGYVLMPNHWHLVLWPEDDGAVSAYVKWLAGTHACHFNRCYRHTGAVYQSRFRSVPVYDPIQLLRVLRYVEANPIRAGLVARADSWHWSSAYPLSEVRLTPSPVPRPPRWPDLLADPTLDLMSATLDGENAS